MPLSQKLSKAHHKECRAIQSLKTNPSIVIKPADKGGATVLMNKAYYIAEANRQLSYDAFYTRMNNDPTFTYKKELKSPLSTLPADTQQQIQSMTANNPKPGTFYLFPKIHKQGNPYRPIVSRIGTITEEAFSHCKLSTWGELNLG